MVRVSICCLALLLTFSESLGQYTITTIIGKNPPPDGPATQSIRPAYFMQKSANEFLILDAHFVWRLDGAPGNLTRILGSGTTGSNDPNDDPLTADLAIDRIAISPGGEIFFVDGSQIKKLSAVTGKIVLVAGTTTSGFSGDNGPANLASFGFPSDIDFGPDGNLYICDDDNRRIRKVNLSTNVVNTVGGTGSEVYNGEGIIATNAGMWPQSLTFDQGGNIVFSELGRIRKIAFNIVTTIAGNGTTASAGDGGLATAATTSASFNTTIASDAQGNIFFSESYIIRKITAATGVISRYAGTPGVAGYAGDNGPATLANLQFTAVRISVGLDGALYLAETDNSVVRKVDAAGTISTIAGNGISGYYSGDGNFTSTSLLSDPWGITFDANNFLYVASGALNRVFRLDLSSNQIITVAGTGARGFSGDNGLATQAKLNSPWGVAVDGFGNVYIADQGNNRIRKVAVGTGIITTLAGSGLFASFNGDNIPALTANLHPVSVVVDMFGNLIFSDLLAQRIRLFDRFSGMVTTIAGNGTGGPPGDGGLAINASVRGSRYLHLTPESQLYIAETFYHVIRKVDLTTGLISRVAGTTVQGFTGDDGPALDATFSLPASVVALEDGSVIISDSFNERIRKVDQDGIVTTVAGSGRRGADGDGDGNTHALSIPRALAVNQDGEIFFSETNGHKIRKLAPGAITGLGEVTREDSEVSMFPVPVKANLTVSARKQDIENITVLSTAGIPLAHVQVQGRSANIDFRDYPTGIYLIRVEQKNLVTIKKVVHVDR